MEAVRCMPRPGVADLCCARPVSCCEPDVSLADIPADVVEQWDATGQLPADVDPDDAGVWLPILEQHTAAIEVAHETLANVVCLARYAASCCVTATVCVDAACCCACDCRTCLSCVRESVRLDKVCVPRDRAAAVTIGNVDVLEQMSGPSVEWCDGTWRLFDPPTGVFEVRFELAEASAAWSAAVAALACAKVPCGHAASCDREEDRQWTLNRRSLGIFGIDCVDDLAKECCNAGGVYFGGGREPVRFVKWGACDA